MHDIDIVLNIHVEQLYQFDIAALCMHCQLMPIATGQTSMGAVTLQVSAVHEQSAMYV